MKASSRVGTLTPTLQSSKTLRWTVGLGAIAMVVIGLLLLYLLTQATNNQELNERNYARLFVVNVVVASALLGAILWVGYRLVMRLRQGRFGSRLLVKLAAIFALVGVAPGLLVFGVSYQFVSSSIETWFNVKVEGALDAGLSLGRVTLDTLASDLTAKTRTAAVQVSETSELTVGLTLDRLIEQLSAADATVWSTSGKLLASAGLSRFQLTPDKPTPAQFRAAKVDRALSWIEGLDETAATNPGRVQVKVLVPLTSSVLGLAP